MNFDVYCDENRPDLLSSEKSQANYMVIGSLWLRSEDRDGFKTQIHQLREKYHIGGEFKWQKASFSRIDFYRHLIDWFFGQGDNLRFRCIVVEHNKVDLIKYHNDDQELGFYKFYYQMLHHWIFDFNEYSIFCDFKTNRYRNRLHELKRCLSASNLSSNILNVQAVRSRESVLMQLIDVLTGAVSARLNNSLQSGSAKDIILSHFENRLGRRIAPTYRHEQKLNVFKINLAGGW